MKQVSIKRKLVGIIMFTSMVSLLLPSLGYLWYDYTRLRDLEIQELNILSRIIASNSSASLSFKDSKNSRDILGGLRHDPRIQEAVIFDADNRPFAASAEDSGEQGNRTVRPDGLTREADYFFLTQPIELDGKRIGTLQIKGNFHHKNRLKDFSLIVLLMSVVSLAAAYLISSRLQAKISKPIMNLTQVAQRVSQDSDYSLRADFKGDDELALLVEQFNAMLDQIKNRDAALHEAQTELERRVKERTSALEIANFRLHLGMSERKKVENVIKSQNQILEFIARGRSLTETLNVLTNAVESQVDRVYCSVFTLDESRKFLRMCWAPSLPEGLLKVLDRLPVNTEAASCGTAVLRKETVITESIANTYLWTEYKAPALSAGFRSCWSQPFFDHKGKVLGTFAMYSDTVRKPSVEELRLLKSYANLVGIAVNRKRIEEGMQDYAMELARSNQDLDDFAAIASHDLQEPLRKVITFGDRLMKGLGEKLEGRNKDYFERMIKSTERMQKFLNDLLDYSRVNTKAEPFITTNLENLIQEVLYDLELRIQNSRGTVDIGQLPFIEVDPRQIKQLFQNLIGNALKFHKENQPPKIRISATISGPNVEIRVQDNGIGFDEIYLDRVFKPFERLHGRDQFEGSGMGLAICRKIVQRHQGFLTAQSQPGKGTTFIITLPKIQES